MARAWFGGGAADFVFTSTAGGFIRRSAATLTFWSAATGGTRYTDLLLNGSAVTSISVGNDGQVPEFQGPDGVVKIWADAGGGTRVQLDAAISSEDGAVSTLVESPTSLTRVSLNGVFETKVNAASTYVSQTKRPISLRDIAGLDFTGVTDSQAALQAAINNAGVGATIEWGRAGVIRCNSGITLLEHQTLEGGGDFTGAGGTPAAALNFPALTGMQIGVTGGGNNLLRALLIRGPMTGADSTYGYKSAAGSPKFQNVSFVGFGVGCALTDAYYSSFDSCEFVRNHYGIINSNVYNLGMVNTRFYCQYGANDSLFGVGIDGGARPLNIFGGAIEGYGQGGAIAIGAGHAVNLFGTYFETDGPDAWGIVADASQVSLTMKGAFVYLNHHNRFISMTGATSAVIDSSGNKFVCATASTTVPIAYSLPNTTAVKGSVGPDNWAEVLKIGTTHLNPVPPGIRYMAP